MSGLLLASPNAAQCYFYLTLRLRVEQFFTEETCHATVMQYFYQKYIYHAMLISTSMMMNVKVAE